MAKEASLANPSLPLHEVLESEFIALHGELPADYPISADPAIRLKTICSVIHGLKEKRSALCLSGGGIRSAAFGLGILQGLARCHLLDKFHYLSTVAGGGFIGSWLVAWIHRAERGLLGVVWQLAQPDDAILYAKTPEVWGLRAYANYLNPRIGLFSTDTWRLIATYFRNITAMSLILMPLFAAVLTIPWLFTAILMIHPTPNTSLPLWVGVLGVVVGATYVGVNLPSGGNKRGSQRSFLFFCLLPLLVGAFSITTYWAWFVTYSRTTPKWPFLGLTSPHQAVPFIYLGITVHLASWATSLVRGHGFRFPEFLTVLFSGAIFGWLFWLGATKIFPQPLATPELYSVFAVPLFLSILYLDMLVYTIITSRWAWQEDLEWCSRAAAWILSIAMAWIGLSTLTLFGPLFLSRMMIWGMSTVTLSGVVGFVILVAGRLGLVATTLKPDDRMGAVVSLLFNKTIAAYLFGIALIILTVRVLTWEMRLLGEQLYSSAWNLRMTPSLPRANGEYLNVILNTPFWAVALLASGLALFGIAMSYLINPNQFSLQAMYRERLMRVFLGASNKRRNPNPFTGFDETDNILVRQLWVEEKSGRRLFPVINMTLNLIGRRILGSRTQLSESFTVSPLHCGSKDLGYRKSQGGSDDAHYAGGVSLGKAMAMSGAATSPNMGYYTSPLVRLVFTLLNVRFGEWLGNPGPAGRKTFNLRSPNFSAGPIIADTVGLSSAQSPYVTLSDGRHFESLGVYEMVLRRCHYIVVSDASCDPECSFADLGEAVRKIRSDFGIPIEFGAVTIYPRSAIDMLKMPGHNCTIGRIRYSLADGPDAPDGILVYIKPAYYGDEPRDVDVYARRNKYFPHEDTSGRPFTDSQFESYRMLAAYTMRKLCSDHDEEDLDCFIRDILSCHLAMEAPDWLAALLERSTNVPRSS